MAARAGRGARLNGAACLDRQGSARRRTATDSDIGADRVTSILALDDGEQRAVGERGEAREDVTLLVFLMRRRGDIEIAQHVARSVDGLGLVAAAAQVIDQAVEQVEQPRDAAVASAQ